jgi:hypothetical protein
MSNLFDVNGLLKVSASQIQSFLNCPMFWYLNKVKGLPTKVTPALFYGKKFHSCVERSYELIDNGVDLKKLKPQLLQENKFEPEHIDMVMVGWNKNILNNPKRKFIEKSIKIKIGDYAIMRGFIDFYNVNESRVEDHKTIGDWKYALTQEDLKNNLQLMIYCYWVFKRLPKKDKLKVRHNQFFKLDPSQSQFIEDIVTRDYVETYWENNIENTTKKMLELAKDSSLRLEVNKNKKHCGAYGGCCYLNGECNG